LNESAEDFGRAVLLSFQRALWNLVTPGLRAVAVTPDYPRITARFVYETVTEDAREVASEAEAYVAADFQSPVTVDFLAVAIDPSRPRDLDVGEQWVYLRREPDGY